MRLIAANPKFFGLMFRFRVKMNRMRMKIASRLKDAQNTNAMLTTFNELDMSAIMQLRKDNQDAFVKKHGIKMGFMSAFVKASAYALTKQPTVNAVIDGQETVYRDFVDISVAVATPKVYFASSHCSPLCIYGEEEMSRNYEFCFAAISSPLIEALCLRHKREGFKNPSHGIRPLEG